MDKDIIELNHIGKDMVTKKLSNAGYVVTNIALQDGKYSLLFATGKQMFYIDVRVRHLERDMIEEIVNKFWIDPYDLLWLAEWHIKTHIPPFIIFARYENQMDDATFYIISLYKARDKGIPTFKGLLIKTKYTMLLDNWLIKVQEFPNKWRGIV